MKEQSMSTSFFLVMAYDTPLISWNFWSIDTHMDIKYLKVSQLEGSADPFFVHQLVGSSYLEFSAGLSHAEYRRMAPMALARVTTALLALPAVSAVAVPDVEISPGVKMPMIVPGQFWPQLLQYLRLDCPCGCYMMLLFTRLGITSCGLWHCKRVLHNHCRILLETFGMSRGFPLCFCVDGEPRPLAPTGAPWPLAQWLKECTNGWRSAAGTSTQHTTMVLKPMLAKLSGNPT